MGLQNMQEQRQNQSLRRRNLAINQNPNTGTRQGFGGEKTTQCSP